MVYMGNVGVVVSDTDEEKEMIKLSEGDQIKPKRTETQVDWIGRLVMIAEIWQHIEKDNPQMKMILLELVMIAIWCTIS